MHPLGNALQAKGYGELSRRRMADDTIRNVRTVVGAVAIREDTVLLLRRNVTDFMGGQWEIPGGVVELSEDHLAALHREVLEETGLRITRVIRGLGSFEYRSKSGRSTVQLNFLVELSTGIPVLTDHDRFKWVSFDGLVDSGLTDEVMSDVARGFLWLSERASGQDVEA
jgi:8-oxo-dGTP diphosphatase